MLNILITLLVTLSVSALAEDRGLCYSSETHSTRVAEGNVSASPLKSVPRNVRHWLALKASQLVYKLSDLENAESGHEFVELYEAFRREALSYYDHWEYHSDRRSGLKYAIFEPHNENDPWIFAFAGSETLLDWMADLNLGRAQLKALEDKIDHLTNCAQKDKFGNPIASREWIITGHSLGGGLAQIFAFKAQSKRMLLRLVPHRIELVTFNGFGALDLVTPTQATAKIVVPGILAANYFVTGDMVSRIGKHLGQTYELEMPPRGLNPLEIINRHSITTIESLIMSHGLPEFQIAKKAAPPESMVIKSLKEYGVYFDFLTETLTDGLSERFAQVRVLEDAAEIILSRGLSEPFDKDALRYIVNLSTSFAKELKKQVHHPLREVQIKALERLALKLEKLF